MKTPTNFIPIIGPLYADDLHSFPSKNFNFGSSELIQLSTSKYIFSCKLILTRFAREVQEYLGLKQDVVGRGDTLKEAKIKKYGAILSKITDELESRDFADVRTGRLLELYLLYFERLSQEVIAPTFKSSGEITEERQDRDLLEELTTFKDEPVRRLKVG